MAHLSARQMAAKVTVFYFVVSGIWILFSDQVLFWAVRDPAWLTRLQTAKGWLFVVATAAMLYWLIKHYLSILQEEGEKLRETSESLRVKEADLDQAQAVGRLGSWRLDGAGDVLSCSDEIYRIFQVERGTYLTLEDLSAFVHPDDRLFVNSKWEAAVKGHPYDLDHRIQADDSVKWVRQKAELEFDLEGHLVRGFGTIQDITDRKQMEFDLLSAMKAAEESSRTKSQFLANVSHELRTPLTGIMSSLELLQDKIEGPDRETLLKIADESAHRLLSIIGDLLDYANLEAGRLQLREQAFSLRRFLSKTLEMFEPVVQKKGIEIDARPSPSLPDEITADSHLLGQVLSNLVANAVKFTERGKITVTAEIRGDDLVFTVADTGIGIVPETIDHLFEPFAQADGSITRRYGGTGLGLTISRELVELMGGRIWAESELGRGSTFSFSLPFTRPE